MRLIRCHIDSFGKLNQFDLDFDPSLTSLLRENGFGKTTLAVFIRAMLFDFSPSRKRKDLSDDDRGNYTPWQTGQSYGGWLEFETQGKRYRIIKSFPDRNKTKCTVVDLETGLQTDRFGEEPGYALLGIREQGFENTLYFSQRRLNGPEAGTAELTEKLISLGEGTAVPDLAGYEKAMASLKKSLSETKTEKKTFDSLKTENYIKKQEAKRTAQTLPTLKAELKTEKEKLDALDAEDRADRRSLTLASVREQDRAQQKRISDLKTSYEEIRSSLEGREPDDPVFERFFDLSRSFREGYKDYQSMRPDQATLDRYSELLSRFSGKAPDPASVLKDGTEYELAERDVRTLRARKDALSQPGETDERAPEKIRVLKDYLEYSRLADMNKDMSALSEQEEKTVSEGELLFSDPDLVRHDKEVIGSLQKERQTPAGPIYFLISALFLTFLTAGILTGIFVHPAFFALAGAGSVGCIVWSVLILMRERRRKRAGSMSSEAVRVLSKYNLPRDVDPATALSRIDAMMHEYGRLAEKREHWFGYDSMVRDKWISFAPDFDWTESDRSRAAEILRQLEERQTGRAEAQSLEKQLSSAEERLSQSAGKIQSVMTEYGYDNIPAGDFPARFVKDVGDYEKALEAMERISLADKKLTGIKEELNALGLPFADGDLSPAALEKTESGLRKTLNECAVAAASLKHAEEEREAFLASHGQELETLSSIPESDTPESVEERISARREAREVLGAKISDFESRIRNAQDAEDSIREFDEIDEMYAQKIRETDLKEHHLELTMTYLENAKNTLSSRYLNPMRTHFREYLDKFGSNPFAHSDINTALDVQIHESGALHPASDYSEGQKDLLSVCRHFALIEAIYDGATEQPFLILDDPFADFDDHTLDRALELVRDLSSRFQIIYLTCHSSRQGGND